MKLFVDTGNLREVEALAQLGILDGVTTNPSLLAKEAGDYRHLLKQICQTVKGPVSAEVVATDTAGMLREGRDLALIDEHIVIKVPFTKDGVRACKTLASEGHRVNVTLIFSAAQAWFFASRMKSMNFMAASLCSEFLSTTMVSTHRSDPSFGTMNLMSLFSAMP